MPDTDEVLKTYYGSIDVAVDASSKEDAHAKITEAIMVIVFDPDAFEDNLSIEDDEDDSDDEDDGR